MITMRNTGVTVLGIVFSVLAGLCPAWAQEPVHFADATLKAVVEDTLWMKDPTPADLLGLTDLSYNGRSGPRGMIRDLAGLE